MANENKEITNEQQGTENPETLENTIGNTELFLDQNQSKIKNILIGIIVVLGGYIGINKLVLEPAEIESQDALWEAQYIFENDTSFVEATELFQDIVNDYSSTEAGNIANLYLGISQMKQGNFEDAIEALEDFEGSGLLMPAIGKGLLGDCYSENGESEKAISLYKKAASSAKSKVYSPYFLKKAGILLEQNSDNVQAAKLYQRILDVYYYEDIRDFGEERKEIVSFLERAKTAS